MSFWLFPPKHLTFWAMQQVLNKQPCHPYMFLSCVALRGSCAKTSLDWSCWWRRRAVFHHFSHSSVKGIVMCKSHCNSSWHCSLQIFLWQVLGSDTRGLFSQNFIKRFLSGILCLVTFFSGRLGRLHGCLFGCLHIQLRKDLDAKCCFFALCLFLCLVLLREVNILCIKY